MFKMHPTAEVSKKSKVGNGTSIWNQAQIREFAILGENCVIGKNVYIDVSVRIGNNVKVQNNSSIYRGVEIEDDVFIGPHTCFTNDLYPRSVGTSGALKNQDDWTLEKTFVKRGASVGAGSTILCGLEIGEYALVGAGSLVSKDVQKHTIVFGNPAVFKGYVCYCGTKIAKRRIGKPCKVCRKTIHL